MSTKKIILAVMAAALVAVVVVVSRQPTKNYAHNFPPVAPTNIMDAAASSDVQRVEVPVEESKPVVAENSSGEVQVAQKKVSTKPSGKPVKPKPPLQDPDARAAMSLVGADPTAEKYWLAAIFDPRLPDQEREDLMEDLNEDGLSDPKHPGPEDMPLIVNRLRIIEEVVPYADPFMQRHLFEAYKDLSRLLAGQPVQ
jgi:hypothetical protein